MTVVLDEIFSQYGPMARVVYGVRGAPKKAIEYRPLHMAFFLSFLVLPLPFLISIRGDFWAFGQLSADNMFTLFWCFLC